MREWPVPKRWTRPSAAIASADHWLAVSIASAWVVATCSRSAAAAVIQGSAGLAIGVVTRRLRPRSPSRRHRRGRPDQLPLTALDRAIRRVEDLVDDQA